MTIVSALVRPIVMFGLLGAIGYLAYKGNEQAMSALITTFPLVIGFYFGERSALKKPGENGNDHT